MRRDCLNDKFRYAGVNAFFLCYDERKDEAEGLSARPDMKLRDEGNRIYAEYFGDHEPVRVIVPTTELHHRAPVEIEAMAEIPEEE